MICVLNLDKHFISFIWHNFVTISFHNNYSYRIADTVKWTCLEKNFITETLIALQKLKRAFIALNDWTQGVYACRNVFLGYWLLPAQESEKDEVLRNQVPEEGFKSEEGWHNIFNNSPYFFKILYCWLTNYGR